jgi:hypothetical protein
MAGKEKVMKTLNRFIAMLLCISLCVPLAQAQPAPVKQQDAQATNTIAQDVLIIIQQEQVRFTAQKAVQEMRLQIFDQAGQVVYDSGAVTELELTWALRQADGETVKSGLYAYTLSLKEAGAAEARVRRGHLIVDRAGERDGQRDRLWITSQNESGVGTELTVARNEGATIAGTSAASGHKGVQAAEGAPRNGEGESKNENDAAVAAVANGTTGQIAKFTSATDLGNSVMTELNGNVGVGITSPLSKLHILSGANDIPPRLQSSSANSFAAGWDFYHGTTGKGYVGVPGSAVGLAPGEMLLYGSPGTRTSLWAGGARSVTIDTNGNVGIGTISPQNLLHIGPGTSYIQDSRVNAVVASNNTDAGIAIAQNSGTHVLLQASGAGGYIGTTSYHGLVLRTHDQDRMVVSRDGLVGIGTGDPQYKLDVNGITRTNLLFITGGADFAENFEVNVAETTGEAMTTKVEAGMVVSIDPNSPGKLVLSTQAYDYQVAGIISGAGGVKPGMIMSQEGTLAHGQHPVALSGRVYCWVDASNGPIKPGDLLTTSSTPGHAMKAVDAAKAQGAIIGKAMTGLKEGKGLVLVLVTLQ